MKNKINLELKYEEMSKYENELYQEGYQNIVGIDEVGRGPLAGPVVVAGVVLNKDTKILGLDDSKKVSAKNRKHLSEEIMKKARAYSIVEIKAEEIDEMGIAKAITKAIDLVILEISKMINLDFILIDYVKHETEYEILSITKGDQNSNSIAAASIIAKEFRDNLMLEIDKEYPEYGFITNVGYGTKKHKEALLNYGPIKGVHRFSFEPIKSMEGK